MASAVDSQLLHVNNISRYFGDHCAINNISFKTKKGEIVGLLGLNGAGKSTCLKLLSGLIAPSSGEILFNGQTLSENITELNQSIAYLPEHPPLHLDLTIDRQLQLVCNLHQYSKQKAKARIKRVKQQCDLVEVGNRTVGNLSKGFQQRVGIAQTLLIDAELIIFDEPTVGLDPQQLQAFRSVLHEEKISSSIIISSHILSEVEAIADRILILHEGNLVLDAPNDGSQDIAKLFTDTVFAKHKPDLEKWQNTQGVAG